MELKVSADIIECPNCNQHYNMTDRRPKMLPCQHCVSLDCLRKIYRKKKKQHSISTADSTSTLTNHQSRRSNDCERYVDCPVCKKRFFLKHFSDIQDSYLLIQILQQNLIGLAEQTRRRSSNYLQNFFNDIDADGNGYVSVDELHKALCEGTNNNTFERKTVELLLRKYDKNSDGQISFTEFYDLWNYVNEQYSTFSLGDSDNNRVIDAKEFKEIFSKSGANLSQEFFHALVNKTQETKRHGVTFDLYVRFIDQLDLWSERYTGEDGKSFEEFLLDNIFNNFW